MSESDKIASTYKKLSHREHIKKLTDTYIGSIQTVEESMYIVKNLTSSTKIVNKKIDYNPGLYKIIDEILVNAFDQYTRLRLNQSGLPKKDIINTTKIKVSIKNSTISIYNNGNGIDVVKHPTHNQWIPELLFGELLTSTNYDFIADKVTGGKNGYGAKLTNIFSNVFKIITVDHIRKKKYEQTFKNHMEEKEEPIITNTNETPYTEFIFEPDLDIFKLKEINKDMVALIERRVYDLAGCSDSSVSFYFNEKKLDISNFYDYCTLFFNKSEITHKKINDRWEISVCNSDEYDQISFANGVYTRHGGTHVNYVLNKLISGITPYIEKKYKDELAGRTVKSQYIKDNIFIFVKSIIVNPSFSSQTKEILTTNQNAFGSTIEISDDFIKKIVSNNLGDKIIQIINFKENSAILKQEKSSKTIKIPKLDDANKAGTEEWDKCTLILTEGDSAKALAISGLSVIGRDYYGVFPLKGKMLNVRDQTLTIINNNDEISNIKKILGLEYGKKYTSLENSGLRYRYVMIMSDQDYDGSHIKGLFFNFIGFLWKELLEHNFIKSLLTPIVKITKKNSTLSFYGSKEFDIWKKTNSLDGWNVKYYKGLGTNTAKEAKEYFQKLNDNTITYLIDENTNKSLSLAFSKAEADNRKMWLQQINEDKHKPIEQTINMKIKYSEFIDRELIYFSNYDNIRSIPSLLDGLKPSQRKILYSGFKKKLYNGKEIKVAQFIGYVSEITSYHHGEVSLAGTIIAMAQNFVGSNNINLFEPSGQFGTRLGGGKDAASPRYIFTEFSKYDKNNYITPVLFPEDDHPLLNYLNDDGTFIEPQYYIPIIPMVLVNGSNGIGTGFSTYIPSYNPLDIIKNIYLLMDSKKQEKLIPWYNNFHGKIENNGNGLYTSYGNFIVIDDITIEINELPIGVWTDNYKEFLESLKKNDSDIIIKKIINQSTEQDVKFTIKFEKKSLKKVVEGDVHKFFHLKSYININNMHLFNSDNIIQKYNNPEEIITEFYDKRLLFYQKRKDYFLKKLNQELELLEDKIKYIEYIINDKQLLFKSRDIILQKIHELGIKDETLINISALSFSKEKVEELHKTHKNKKEEYIELNKKTPVQLWKNELEIFINCYSKFLSKKN